MSPGGSLICDRFYTGVSSETIAALYRRHDIFVYPSYSDGFPSPPLEAMASGLVVVSAEAGNTRELVGTDLSRGVLVDAAAPGVIASALLSLETDRARHAAIRAHAQAWARERTWTKVWNGLFRDYLRVISARAASS